ETVWEPDGRDAPQSYVTRHEKKPDPFAKNFISLPINLSKVGAGEALRPSAGRRTREGERTDRRGDYLEARPCQPPCNTRTWSLDFSLGPARYPRRGQPSLLVRGFLRWPGGRFPQDQRLGFAPQPVHEDRVVPG